MDFTKVRIIVSFFSSSRPFLDILAVGWAISILPQNFNSSSLYPRFPEIIPRARLWLILQSFPLDNLFSFLAKSRYLSSFPLLSLCNHYQFLSFRVFEPLSSSLLLYSQRFGRCVLRPETPEEMFLVELRSLHGTLNRGHYLIYWDRLF